MMSELSRAKSFAAENGYLIIGEPYGVSARSKFVKLQCDCMHEFECSVRKLAQQKGQCIICCQIETDRETLSEVTEIIKTKLGTPLSGVMQDPNNKYRPRIKIRCKNGHEWSPVIKDIVTLDAWCSICAKTKNTIEMIQKIVSDRGGHLYTTVYENGMQPMRIKCRFENHEIFEIRAGNLITGSWCPKCRKPNVREELVRAIFVEAFGGKPFVRTRKEDFMERLELDGYNAELKLAWEHNGRQHYEQHDKFHSSPEVYAQQVERDKRKQDLCDAAGVKLIVIKYDVPINGLRTHVRSKIIEYGYTNLSDPVGTDLELFDKLRLEGPDSEIQYAKIKELVEGGDIPQGKVVSESYLGADVKMEFKCRVEGHPPIYRRPWFIKNDMFCEYCTRNKNAIKKYQAKVADYGWIVVDIIHIDNPINGNLSMVYRKCANVNHQTFTIRTHNIHRLKQTHTYGDVHNSKPCPDCA